MRAERVATGKAGTLRLGFVEALSWHGVVPDSFRQFRRRQPNVELELHSMRSNEQMEAIRSGHLDAGFIFSLDAPDGDLAHLQVARHKVMLAAPKGHAVTRVKRLRLRDLSDAPFIWFQYCPVEHFRDSYKTNIVNELREKMSVTHLNSNLSCGLPILQGKVAMNSGQTVFAQLIEFLPKHVFRKCVLRYKGDYRCRKFSCRDQFLCMAFAQITYRESLRDIESCLRASSSKLFGLGIRGKISRSTLADANELRDHRIYEDFAMHLVTIAQGLYSAESWGRNLKRSVFALDATTIDLCLSLFPWAKFRKRKGAVKVHALIDVVTRIPTVIRVTPGNIHEVRILDELCFEPGAIYLMDRGYVDFKRLHRLHLNGAFFVIRAKKKARFKH